MTGLGDQELVAPDGSRISRRLFTDAVVYQEELRHIFARCWLFVGHVSQIPGPGDFFLSRMGEESVILTRDREGGIHVLHNSCAHRGMRVCRADHGTTTTFRCPYHFWSYGNDGALIGVPKLKMCYGDGLDKSQWGLRRIRNATYGGMVFATFNDDAPSLDDFLGDMRFYLDVLFDRDPDGLEVIGGVHRWAVDCNWKLPAENQAGDIYHADYTHAAVFELMGAAAAQADGDMSRLMPDGVQVTTDSGHFFVVDRIGEGADERRKYPGFEGLNGADEVVDWYASVQPAVETRLGPAKSHVRPGTGTIFPNFSLVPGVFTIRVAHPVSPLRTELWSWAVVPVNAPSAVKQFIRSSYSSGFGPAGLIEQEDGENWLEMTRACRTAVAEVRPLHVGMGLGQEWRDSTLPGTLGPYVSEHNQRNYYRTWLKHMADGTELAR